PILGQEPPFVCPSKAVAQSSPVWEQRRPVDAHAVEPKTDLEADFRRKRPLMHYVRIEAVNIRLPVERKQSARPTPHEKCCPPFSGGTAPAPTFQFCTKRLLWPLAGRG